MGPGIGLPGWPIGLQRQYSSCIEREISLLMHTRPGPATCSRRSWRVIPTPALVGWVHPSLALCGKVSRLGAAIGSMARRHQCTGEALGSARQSGLPSTSRRGESLLMPSQAARQPQPPAASSRKLYSSRLTLRQRPERPHCPARCCSRCLHRQPAQWRAPYRGRCRHLQCDRRHGAMPASTQ